MGPKSLSSKSLLLVLTSSILFNISFSIHIISIKAPTKVEVPNLVAYFTQTPILEQYVVWCDSKNGYQNDMCLKVTRQHAPNMITILSAIVNIIKVTYMTI
jgi:hypothetical protein